MFSGIETAKRPGRYQLVRELVPFGVRAITPMHLIGLGERSDALNPRSETRIFGRLRRPLSSDVMQHQQNSSVPPSAQKTATSRRA